MMRIPSRCALALLLFCTSSVVATAQTRKWVYRHLIVRDAQGQQVAEFSEITSGNVEPTMQRLLLKIGNDLLVARYELGDTSNQVSYKLVGTGETLVLDNASGTTLTVTLGGNSLTVHEGESVHEQAATLMNSASETFRTALRQLATIGLNTYKPFYPQARTLRLMFFTDLSVASSRNGTDQQISKNVSFNPNSTPSAFDSAFGVDYSQ